MVAIDKEIAKLESSENPSIVQNLKSRRNVLSTICRLPVEVLANIFMDCNTDIPTFVDGNRAKGIVTLFRLARVCRHWRTVALDTPELWSRPDYSSGTPLARIMLSRSKDAPLVVDAEFGSGTRGVVFETLKHIARTTVLHITATDDRAGLQQLVHELVQPAPFLHTLGLGLDQVRAWDALLSPSELHLPHTFLGNHAPRLRNLLLRWCCIPLDSPLLRNLTRLSLISPSLPSSSATHFLEGLREMSHLEVLEVRNPFRETPPATTAPPIRAFTMPALRYLRLDEVDSSGAVFLLGHISLPISTVLTVNSRLPSADWLEKSNTFVSCLSRVFSAKANPTLAPDDSIRSMYIGPMFEVFGWTFDTLSLENPYTRHDLTGKAPPHLRVHVALTTTLDLVGDGINPLRGLVSALPSLNNLRALHVLVPETHTSTLVPTSTGSTSRGVYPSVEDFTACFGALPNLQIVKLKGELAPLLMTALGPAFHALHTLELKSVIQSRAIPQVGGRIADILADVAVSRGKIGVGMLRQLKLTQCESISNRDVERIKEVVAEVDWDGRVQEECDFDLQVDDTSVSSLPSSLYRPSIVCQ
ncbi:hypothetical protein V5O48_001185 [Marasmius crinis-equi]|uniref:F-box domain-containing protein n=1 Tax=Marasmius crinis-equi TaxID=585013 RepID=A0ABR3FZ51_9AGAR